MFSDITDVMSACARENFKKGDKFCYSKSVTFDSCFVIQINFVKHERSVCGNVVYVFIIIRENICHLLRGQHSETIFLALTFL